MHPDQFAALSRSLGDSTSRRGLLRLLGVGAAGTAITVVGLNDVEAKRNKQRKAHHRKAHKRKGGSHKKPSAAPPVVNLSAASGTVTDTNNVTSPYSGTFNIREFDVQDGALVALGSLTPAIPGVQEIAVPVNVAQSEGSCSILHLELGPLDLNLLGLVVHLDRIVLDISAEPGPGNLLGNLLCAIAGLLDGSGALNQLLGQLADLLNQLLGLLNL